MTAKPIAGTTRHCPKRGHGQYVDTGLGCQVCAGVRKPQRGRPRPTDHSEREVERSLRRRPPAGPVDELGRPCY